MSPSFSSKRLRKESNSASRAACEFGSVRFGAVRWGAVRQDEQEKYARDMINDMI